MLYHFSTKKVRGLFVSVRFFCTTALTIQKHFFFLLFTPLSLMQRFVFSLETKHKKFVSFFQCVKNGFSRKDSFFLFPVMFLICSLLWCNVYNKSKVQSRQQLLQKTTKKFLTIRIII